MTKQTPRIFLALLAVNALAWCIGERHGLLVSMASGPMIALLMIDKSY